MKIPDTTVNYCSVLCVILMWPQVNQWVFVNMCEAPYPLMVLVHVASKPAKFAPPLNVMYMLPDDAVAMTESNAGKECLSTLGPQNSSKRVPAALAPS